MPTIGQPSRRPSLVAAASQVDFSPTTTPYKPEKESDELWGLYRALGELRFIVNFKGNAARRLTYFPGVVPEVGQDPDPDDIDPAAQDAFDAVQGPMGAFRDFMAELAEHEEVVGEGFFIGQAGEDGEYDFDVWSSDEYRRASQPGATRQHPDDVHPLTEDDVQVRIWRPDPQWRYRADSPFRAVRTEAETLIMLMQMTQALVRSRLTAKILGIPEELSFPSNNDEEEQPGSDPFTESLLKAVVTSVTDHQSAARFAPLVIRGRGEDLQNIVDIDLTREMPDWIQSLIDQTIRRLAAGMDIPAEVLSGMADVNHWTAWQIEESAYKQHVDPLVTMILDSLTRGYLWPYLRETGMAEERVRQHVFWRDYSDLTARTASVDSAIQVFDRGGLSLEALRRTTGFNEADAPEEEVSTGDVEELQNRVEAVGALIRAGYTPEGAAAALGLPEIPHTGFLPVTLTDRRIEGESDVEVEVVSGEGEGGDEEELPAGPDNTDQGPPLTAALVAEDLGDVDQRVFTQLQEASQVAFDQVMQRAGGRIRREVLGGSRGSGRAPKHPSYANAIDGLEGRQIALTLGKGTVTETLQLSDDDLIPPDAFATLGRRVRDVLRRGQEDTQAAVSRLLNQDLTFPENTWADRASEYLTDALRLLGLTKLFTPDTTPNPAETGEVSDSVVPAGDVWDSMTIASGGEPAATPEAPRGLATGQQTEEWITESGAIKEGYVWRHGSPRIPFEPHQRLSGTRFERWTSEELSTPGYASWLRTPYMFPGDHRGCTCSAVPIVIPPEEENGTSADQ